MPDHDELAPFLTVLEAAALLRISRTSAYEQARRYLFTGGREGLPVVRVGRCLRVPRRDLLTRFSCSSPDATSDGRQSSTDVA